MQFEHVYHTYTGDTTHTHVIFLTDQNHYKTYHSLWLRQTKANMTHIESSQSFEIHNNENDRQMLVRQQQYTICIGKLRSHCSTSLHIFLREVKYTAIFMYFITCI